MYLHPQQCSPFLSAGVHFLRVRSEPIEELSRYSGMTAPDCRYSVHTAIALCKTGNLDSRRQVPSGIAEKLVAAPAHVDNVGITVRALAQLTAQPPQVSAEGLS